MSLIARGATIAILIALSVACVREDGQDMRSDGAIEAGELEGEAADISGEADAGLGETEPDDASERILGTGITDAGRREASDDAPSDQSAAAVTDGVDAAESDSGVTSEAGAEELISRAGRPDVLLQARASCERQGGRFGPTPSKNAFVCYVTLKDANERCASADDCSGLCLARSRTCSPIEPFFGCHDVLLRGGQRATQCVE